MVSKSLLRALSAASIFVSPTTALPARTHCVCTIVDATTAHLRPLEPSFTTPSSTRQLDICSTLGPELETFRARHPDQYSSFISESSLSTALPEDPTATDEEKPLSTTVLLQLAAKNGFQNLGVVLPSAPTDRPQERIVCRTEFESDAAYQDSVVTLLALQIIVGFAMLACVAEGIMLGVRMVARSCQNTCAPALRLSGDERHLRAFPNVERLLSPGAEKKIRAYNSPYWTPRPSCEKKEFEAYLEEEDDEINRPVL